MKDNIEGNTRATAKQSSWSSEMGTHTGNLITCLGGGMFLAAANGRQLFFFSCLHFFFSKYIYLLFSGMMNDMFFLGKNVHQRTFEGRHTQSWQ